MVLSTVGATLKIYNTDPFIIYFFFFFKLIVKIIIPKVVIKII